MQTYFKSLETFLMVNPKYRVLEYSTQILQQSLNRRLIANYIAYGGSEVANFLPDKALRHALGVIRGVQQLSAPR